MQAIRALMLALLLTLAGGSAAQAQAIPPAQQSAQVMKVFANICGDIPADTQGIVARALGAGMDEAEPSQGVRKTTGQSTRKFVTHAADGTQTGVIVSASPARCVVFGTGIAPAPFEDGALGLFNRLKADDRFANVTTKDQSGSETGDKVHRFVHADLVENGEHLTYLFTAGGNNGNNAVLMVTLAPRQKVPELSASFVTDIVGDAATLEPHQRNSEIALRVFKKVCMDMYGDYPAASAWAKAHMPPDGRFKVSSDKMSSWQIRDKDVYFTLMVADDPKRFCMFSGGPVDANLIHDNFKTMQDNWAAQEGHSISPDGFTGHKYDQRPNDMPNYASYYAGAIFHSPAHPEGMDVVISTKPMDGYMSLVIDVTPGKPVQPQPAK